MRSPFLTTATVGKLLISVPTSKKHRLRLVGYETCQELQPGSSGSPAVESAVKQIGRRLKISGAQWKSESVSQLLQLRCAYLNGEFAV
jgi:hypothetical protein